MIRVKSGMYFRDRRIRVRWVRHCEPLRQDTLHTSFRLPVRGSTCNMGAQCG